MIIKMILNNYSFTYFDYKLFIHDFFFYFVNCNCRNPKDEYIYANYDCKIFYNDFFNFTNLQLHESS
jgi:hypothetical protein